MHEQFSIKGKRIVITGGAQGIGKCVAQLFAQEGALIGIFDINAPLAKVTAAQIAQDSGIKCLSYACDVTEAQSVQAAFDSYIADFGALDAVFNNAGIASHKPAEDITPKEWLDVINVDLNGVFYVAQAAGKYFINNGIKGAIVNTASMSGTIVNIPQEQSSYNAAKAAVVHLTKSLAVEWAKYGIRVNSISPGYIFTEMTSTVREDWRNFWTDLIPFKRMGTPEELAGGVLYLLSDAASYTSGCDLIMDGCFTCI